MCTCLILLLNWHRVNYEEYANQFPLTIISRTLLEAV